MTDSCQLESPSEEVVLELTAALNKGLAKILDASGDSFDDKAAVALRTFAGGIKQINELPDDVGSRLLAELNEKKAMLEFLSRVSNEKRAFSKVSQLAIDRLLMCPCYQETWKSGGDYIDIFKARELSEAKAKEADMAARDSSVVRSLAVSDRTPTASTPKYLAGASALPVQMNDQDSAETKQAFLDAQGVQYVVQAKAALRLGLSQVIASNVSSKVQGSGHNPFDAKAAVAFKELKRGVEMIRELPDSVANDALAGVDEKKSVIKFLLRLAKEKAMFSRQVESILDVLLRCPAWQETWEENAPKLKTKFDAEEALESDGQMHVHIHARPSLRSTAAAPAAVAETVGVAEVDASLPEAPAQASPSVAVLADSLPAAENDSGDAKPTTDAAQLLATSGTPSCGAAVSGVSDAQEDPGPRQRKRDKLKGVFGRAACCITDSGTESQALR